MFYRCLFFALALLLGYIVSTHTGVWMLLQCMKSVVGRSWLPENVDTMEIRIWEHWGKHHNPANLTRESNLLNVVKLIKDLDLTRPFVIKNLSSTEFLTLELLTSSPIGDIDIDYFTDARRDNTVPDARAALRVVAKRIIDGGVEKFGTQMIIKTFPSILTTFVDENPWLTTLFGETRTRNWKTLAPTVTAPVFMSRGQARPDRTEPSLAHTTRTDLHCEPISNVVVQTEGRKSWTLIDPTYWKLLRPTVAPDGRAYFYSRLDPLSPTALYHVPRYEIETEAGDVLYVPTWTWHRVEYLQDSVAVSLSVFEFVPLDYLVRNFPLAVTLVPNIIKEAVGLKIQ